MSHTNVLHLPSSGGSTVVGHIVGTIEACTQGTSLTVRVTAPEEFAGQLVTIPWPTAPNVIHMADQLRLQGFSSSAPIGALLRAEIANNHAVTIASAWMDAPNFECDVTGIHAFDAKGNALRHPVAHAPINVVAVGEDEQGEQVVVVRYLSRGRPVTRVVPRMVVTTKDICDLARYGAPVTQPNANEVIRFLAAQAASNLLHPIKAFTRMGWSDDKRTFVVGEHVIGEAGVSLVNAERRFLVGMHARGDEMQYRRIAIDARGKSVDAWIGFACGYAPVLLRLLGLRCLVVSIYGASTGGKTATQKLATSAWGDPEQLKLSGDMSVPAAESICATMRDLVVHVDDTQVSKPEFLKALAYQVCSGTGRPRSGIDGKLRKVPEWLTLCFISGEQRLVVDGAADGFANRTIELKVKPFERAYAQNLHVALEEHHGHTGPRFVEAIMRLYPGARGASELKEIYKGILKRLGSDEKARLVATLVMADFLAMTLVFNGHATAIGRRALAQALANGKEMLARMAGSAPKSVVDNAYEKIVAYVRQHQEGFMPAPDLEGRADDQPLEAHEYAAAKVPHERLGAFVEHEGAKYVAILPEAFGEISRVEKFPVDQVTGQLEEKGLLLRGDGSHMGRKTSVLKLPTGTAPRAYWIRFDDVGDAT